MSGFDAAGLRPRFQASIAIAIALIGGCVLFAGVVFVLSSGAANETPDQDFSVFRLAAVIAGVMGLSASFFLKALMLRRPDTPPVQLPRLDELGARLQTATLVSCAAVEGAVMFGLIVAFLSRQPQDLFTPLVLGVIGFGAHFPRWGDWERWVKERQ
jgi:hypothetical protein